MAMGVKDYPSNTLIQTLLTDKKDKLVNEKIKQLLEQAQIEIFVPNLISDFSSGSKQS